MLLDTRRDREDIGIEDDVQRRESDHLRQQFVGPLTDLDLAFDGIRLPVLVERHHHDASAEPHDCPRPVEELTLPLLEADRVDDPLALNALETREDH